HELAAGGKRALVVAVLRINVLFLRIVADARHRVVVFDDQARQPELGRAKRGRGTCRAAAGDEHVEDIGKLARLGHTQCATNRIVACVRGGHGHLAGSFPAGERRRRGAATYLSGLHSVKETGGGSEASAGRDGHSPAKSLRWISDRSRENSAGS